MKIKSDNIVLITFYLVFFITSIFVNTGNAIVSSVSYFIVILIACFSSINTDIIILFSIIPFPRIFLLSPDFMTIVPIIEGLIIVKYYFKTKIGVKSLRQIKACFILLIYSCIVEYLRFSTISSSIKYMLTIFTMIVVWNVTDSNLRKRCFVTFCISSFLSGIVGWYYPNVSAFTSLYVSPHNKRFQGLMPDPGSFGQIMICTISMVVFLLATSRYHNRLRRFNIKSIITSLILCLTCLYFIFQSGTRACLIGIAVIYFVIILKLLKSKRSVKIRSLGVFALLISLILLVPVSNYLFNAISLTHGGDGLDNEKRFLIWRSYINGYLDSIDVILFGVGMDSCNIYGKLMGFGNPHNVIIEKVYESGLIGLIINLAIFTPIVKSKNMRLTNMSALPFYAFFSTLLVYGSVGIELPYFLLALIDSKGDEYSNKKAVLSHS